MMKTHLFIILISLMIKIFIDSYRPIFNIQNHYSQSVRFLSFINWKSSLKFENRVNG